MNKGIIYEECSRYDNALDCYLNAVNTFNMMRTMALFKRNG